jgi:hypothetical protein
MRARCWASCASRWAALWSRWQGRHRPATAASFAPQRHMVTVMLCPLAQYIPDNRTNWRHESGPPSPSIWPGDRSSVPTSRTAGAVPDPRRPDRTQGSRTRRPRHGRSSRNGEPNSGAAAYCSCSRCYPYVDAKINAVLLHVGTLISGDGNSHALSGCGSPILRRAMFTDGLTGSK